MIFFKTDRDIGHKSDEDLLQEFTATGDLEVLGRLYSGYMPLVYGVCLKYLKDREESKDAVMQVFEKLIAEIPKQKIGNFRNWLHIVTKNYCLMQLRSQKTQDERMSEWMADSAIFMENSFYLHPIDEEVQQFDIALADCIERLKGEQKQCIRQFYYDNRCYNEIAINLNLEEKKSEKSLTECKKKSETLSGRKTCQQQEIKIEEAY